MGRNRDFCYYFERPFSVNKKKDSEESKLLLYSGSRNFVLNIFLFFHKTIQKRNKVAP